MYVGSTRTVVCMGTKHMAWHAVGTVDECGYKSKQKDAICEAHRPYQTISEVSFSLILTDSLGLQVAQMPRNRDLAGNNRQTDKTDWFTPCACV